MKKILIAVSLGLALFLPQAHAGWFSLSYDLGNGDTLSATLGGTLQADNNTIFVNSVSDFATVGSFSFPSLPFVGSLDATISGFIAGSGSIAGVGILTLDNSFLDFIACDEIDCNRSLFVLAAGNGFAESIQTPVYADTFQNEFPLILDNLDIRELPVPATLPLLAMGAAILAWQCRKIA